IPSKALLDSSELYHLAHERFGRHGIQLSGLTVDVPTMLTRKDQVVKGLTDGVRFLFKKNRIEPVFGGARIVSPEAGAVRLNDGGDVTIEAAHILVATGSEAVPLPFLPFDGKTIVSSTEALCFDKVPEHLVVVGAGYIGLELGSVWRRLGAKVTVIEFLSRIVPMADVEVGERLKKRLVKQGLEFHLETKVTGAKFQGDKVTVAAETKDGKGLTVECDKVLVAVGRRPYSEGLGLQAVGVNVEAKTGKVPVDEHFRT